MKIAILFPGQGSQFLGMGREFIDSSAECRAIMEMTEDICKAPIGSLCQEGPLEELTKAVHLQPAITAVNLMCWRMLEREIAGKVEIGCCAGHSLGEYSALHAAGVISAEDAIRLVAQRGALMGREGEKFPGGMRAVLGLTIAEVEMHLGACPEAARVTAANHNTDQQIVISGDIPGLDVVCAAMEQAGAKVIPLNVSVANHSPLVADAVPDFSRFMADITFSSPRLPLYFNVTAAEEHDPAVIKDIMARQIASRVRWYESMLKMIDAGVSTFIEVGPKNVLKGMMRKIAPKDVRIDTLQFDTPAGLNKCLEQLL